MKSPHRRDVSQDEPGMTSMIDVVFLLLVFFVWTSSFDEPEKDISSLIAISEQASEAVAGQDAAKPTFDPADQEPRSEEIVVRIIAGRDGLHYQIGSVDAAAASDVFSKLQKIAALQANTDLIVDPDDDIDFADCIDVYDYALRLGFTRVLFAVD